MIPLPDCPDCDVEELCPMHAPCDECQHPGGLHTLTDDPLMATCWGDSHCSACLAVAVANEAPSLELGL